MARYYDLDKDLLQADPRLFSQFNTPHAEKKKIKTAAEVIEVLHNSLLEMIAAE